MNGPALSRRQWLLGSAALAAAGGGLRADDLLHPLAARAPHAPARAKRVIFFFMTGGLSHVDTWDPKPKLQALAGKEAQKGRVWVPSPWEIAPRGESGLLATDLFPHVNSVVDELCVMRSLHGNHNDHFEATLHMHTGSDGSARPGIGAWVSYGLGTENPNLPSHIVFAKEKPYAGSQSWDSNFLPAYHQGVRVEPGDEPIPHLKPYGPLAGVQDLELDRVQALNRRHAQERGGPGELLARMLSFDTAATSRASPTTCSTSTGPSAGTTRASAGSASWRGGWPSAGCASSSSSTPTGTITGSCARGTRPGRAPWTVPSPG
jgi:hypothetical protein